MPHRGVPGRIGVGDVVPVGCLWDGDTPAPVLVGDVEDRLAKVPNVDEVEVALLFDPPWSRDMMTEEAQLELGLF